jgi:putative PIN family toxin of toxin-antitoxin system
VSIKAVLDTNVVISGIFWKGPPFEILKAWRQRRFTLVLSQPILDEYKRVIAELSGKLPSTPIHSILEILESHSLIVEPRSFTQQVCDDPDDDKFLEAAIAAQANYVVTGDAALLRVEACNGIKILRATQFLKILLP